MLGTVGNDENGKAYVENFKVESANNKGKNKYSRVTTHPIPRQTT